MKCADEVPSEEDVMGMKSLHVPLHPQDSLPFCQGPQWGQRRQFRTWISRASRFPPAFFLWGTMLELTHQYRLG